jgi:hypothetical protein
MRWGRGFGRMGERKGVCKVLVGKRERKRPLRRPRHRWEDNIKMGFSTREIGT